MEALLIAIAPRPARSGGGPLAPPPAITLPPDTALPAAWADAATWNDTADWKDS